MSDSANRVERPGGLKPVFVALMSKVDAFFTASVGDDQPNTAKPDFNTQMAVERTLLAHERTLMAWVRTATSLITFGFTIYKFFQLEAKGRVLSSQIIGPRTFASLMILMGLFALAIATIQHHQSVRREKKYGIAPRTLAGWIAALISILGLLAITAVFFNI
jgi:putative membrane protein